MSGLKKGVATNLRTTIHSSYVSGLPNHGGFIFGSGELFFPQFGVLYRSKDSNDKTNPAIRLLFSLVSGWAFLILATLFLCLFFPHDLRPELDPCGSLQATQRKDARCNKDSGPPVWADVLQAEGRVRRVACAVSGIAGVGGAAGVEPGWSCDEGSHWAKRRAGRASEDVAGEDTGRHRVRLTLCAFFV